MTIPTSPSSSEDEVSARRIVKYCWWVHYYPAPVEGEVVHNSESDGAGLTGVCPRTTQGQSGGYSSKGPPWAEIAGLLMTSATTSALLGTQRGWVVRKVYGSDKEGDRVSQPRDFRQAIDKCAFFEVDVEPRPLGGVEKSPGWV